MNSRPDAWLRQARNDLALAQLAKDNGFLAQSCTTHHKQLKRC